MPDTPRGGLEIRSKEEFRAALEQMSARLHSRNRVALGERVFVWEVAEMLTRLGRVFDEHFNDKDIQTAFGDGWTQGTLSPEERRTCLFRLLYEEK